jgi:predicted Zn-dependent protease
MFLLPTWRHVAAANLIRDTEIENTIRDFSTPLFEAAGLRSSDIDLFIISDPALNAFVAGGMNLFIHTGLLMRVKDANQLIGVLAHETGHISGGHLVRFSKQIETGNTAAMLATVLGVVTAIASGNAGAGMAIAQSGQGLAVGSLLNYSRAQESAADQAGLELLDRTGQSALGMRSFFGAIEDQELLASSRQDAYVRTHPITRNRMRHVDGHLKKSRYTRTPPPPEHAEKFKRLQAKLFAFTKPMRQTFARYKKSDSAIAARYARAIAYYRLADLKQGLPLMDGLIKAEPKNPYFYEMKGQMLFENGRMRDSIVPYAKAIQINPDAPLIRIGLARAQLESNDPALIKKAISNLLLTTQANPNSAFAWNQLAVAYGRNGQLGFAALSLAEAALIRGHPKDARYQIWRAEKKLVKGSAGWIRAQDIKRTLRTMGAN